MLGRTGQHALHWLMELLVLGLAALALGACVLAWRLAQGPIDITPLVRREQVLLAPPGMQLSIDDASLAWEGFKSSDSPLDLRISGVRFTLPDQGLAGQLRAAHVTLSVAQLLQGRIAPRSLTAESLAVSLHRASAPRANAPANPPRVTSMAETHGTLLPAARRAAATLAGPRDDFARPADGATGLQQLLAGLRHIAVHHAQATVADDALGLTWQVKNASMDLRRPPQGGVAGAAHADLSAGAVEATLDLTASMQAGGSVATLAVSPVSPAVLATLSPALAGLAALDAPVTAHAQADLLPSLGLRQARIDLAAGAGAIRQAGTATAIASAEAHVTVTPGALHLDGFRLAFAALPGKHPPPVIAATASATRAAGTVAAHFILDLAALDLADLAAYWPPSVGGGSRDWLTQNITSGFAHDAHVEGALEMPQDFSDIRITALSGSMQAQDVTLFWLKPVPPVTHAKVRLDIEGPDALRVVVDSAEQNGIKILPGSGIEITKLEENHQFGDITAQLAGPLAPALAILNHPRLNLLSRGGFSVAGASGNADARLTVHIPLEAHVTMDDIRIAATATLSDVYLGAIAAGRDLDRASLALKVDNEGLQMTGTGAFAGIPTSLVLGMDFTAGGESQVVQHVTAHGDATAAAAKAAGLPDAAAAIFKGGTAAIGVDFTARRDRSSTVLLDADLTGASLDTPVGWRKADGETADAGARLSFTAGVLTGIDHVHAKGPGLLIAGHAKLQQARTHALVIDRLELGQTRAHGEIGLAATPTDKLAVSLEGSMLDLSGYLDQPPDQRADAVPSRPDNAPQDPGQKPALKPAPGRGHPWQADLHFDSIMLAKGKSLSPFALTAHSNGLHIVQAGVAAGRPGELAVRLAPSNDGRTISVVSGDAGIVLRGLGVADNLNGGHLVLDGRFDDGKPGDPLTGTATLDQFTLRQAPAITRLLQGMTLYGLTDVLRGPGLHFSRAIVPFAWRERVLTLRSTRAFSPSLGFTAQGTIDLARRVADVKGTVVPAYFFNQLLGDLPLLGRLFSPEKGGGVFAARYAVTGPLADPHVGVNPLSALTPGFLREGFGLLPHAAAAGK